MTEATFLNVGDGACALYSGWSVPDWLPLAWRSSLPDWYGFSTMIVDCGTSGKDKAADAALLLDKELGEDRSHVDTILVSHFDADHWEGLLAWARRIIRQNEPLPLANQDVTLVYPRLPRLVKSVQKFYMAMITIERDQPSLASLDLASALRSAGAIVNSNYKGMGDQFISAGKDWEVLWPPQELPASWSSYAASVIREVVKLADEIPGFDDVLESGFGPEWREQDPGDDLPWREQASADAVELEQIAAGGHLDLDLDLPGLDAGEGSAADDNEVPLPAGLKGEARRRYLQVRGEIQALNNALSLVIAAKDRSIISYGDAEGWALTRLAELGTVGPRYDVLVAPHHGTAKPSIKAQRGLPEARVVVCQNGRARFQGRQDVYSPESRHADETLHTWRDGTIRLSI
jgi:hypothetical protein